MGVLVSVIIPIYNSERYLEKCLTSIVDQSYSELEIIIVDSGCRDGSRKIVEKYAAKDRRIILMDADGPGPANARMAGYKIAKGKYITFVDSDDYIEDDCIYKFVRTAEKNKSELVICGYTSETPEQEILRKMIPTSYRKGQDEIWPYRICSSWGRFYLRDLWYRYDVRFIHEDGAIGEDMPVSFLTNVMAKNISVVPSVEYHYVRHGNSIMDNMLTTPKYSFPYEGMRATHDRLAELKFENSKDFYYLGLLKFFSKYQFELARKASLKEKQKFRRFIAEITENEISDYFKAWNNLKKRVELPLKARLGMLLMLIEICLWKIA